MIGASTTGERVAVRPLLANLSGVCCRGHPEIVGFHHMGASAMLTVKAPRALMFCTVLWVSVRLRATVSLSCMVPQAAFITLTVPSSL